MKLSTIPLADALAAFRSSAPTPGGGSASALAGALGASLLAMVASMPKHRAASEEDVDRLQAAAARGVQLSDALTTLIDRDSDAYDQVAAAYKLPKASDEEKAARSARIQEALVGAVEAPLAVMQRAAEAIEISPVVARFGNPNASSDVGVALELLGAAMRGAKLNVEINLGGIKDAAYVDRTRRLVEEIARECETGIAAARRTT